MTGHCVVRGTFQIQVWKRCLWHVSVLSHLTSEAGPRNKEGGEGYGAEVEGKKSTETEVWAGVHHTAVRLQHLTSDCTTHIRGWSLCSPHVGKGGPHSCLSYTTRIRGDGNHVTLKLDVTSTFFLHIMKLDVTSPFFLQIIILITEPVISGHFHFSGLKL